MVLGAVFLLVRYYPVLLDVLRDLIRILRDLWNQLRIWPARASSSRTEPQAELMPRRRPFSTFSNPFQTGMADRSRPEDLVSYSFEALEAWAWEHDLGRQPQETPIEFATRLGRLVPVMAVDCRQLAVLYSQVAYAQGLSDSALPPTLQRLWDLLSHPEGVFAPT